MKALKYIIGSILPAFLSLGLFQSCQSLEENPAGALVSNSFFQTAEDLDAAVTGTYAQLTFNRWGGFGHTNIWTPLFGADDLTSQVNKPDYVQFDCFAATSMNGSLKAGSWTPAYRVIYAANTVLKFVEQVNTQETKKTQAKAEVSFLRAWSYFWLTRVYGEVPLQLDNEMNYTLPKSSIKDVYTQIISDLE